MLKRTGNRTRKIEVEKGQGMPSELENRVQAFPGHKEELEERHQPRRKLLQRYLPAELVRKKCSQGRVPASWYVPIYLSDRGSTSQKVNQVGPFVRC